MMASKSAVAALLFTCGVANAASIFGIVRLDGNGRAYVVTAQPLLNNQDVQIQFPNEGGNTVCCKRVSHASFKPMSTDQVRATNELADAAPYIYSAEVPRGWARAPFVGMAVIGRKLKVRNSWGRLEARENGGSTHVATTCFSKEGIHLIESVRKSERTHLYVRLGYDLEKPTCPE